MRLYSFVDTVGSVAVGDVGTVGVHLDVAVERHVVEARRESGFGLPDGQP